MNEREDMANDVMNWMRANTRLKMEYVSHYYHGEGLSRLDTNEERRILIQLINLSEGI